jgi:hypothetical protein
MNPDLIKHPNGLIEQLLKDTVSCLEFGQEIKGLQGANKRPNLGGFVVGREIMPLS